MAALELGLHLPEEIIEQEILSRITSVKSLLKFRCVSKSWRCLIDRKQFIKAHLENSRKNTRFLTHTVIFYVHALHQYCTLQSLVNGASSHLVEDPPMPKYDRVSVVGGSNGLVCLLDRSRYFMIMWNPSTRKSRRLPEIDHGVTNGIKVVHHCGIGFEPSGEYKILAVIGEKSTVDYVGKVYSSKTNSWNPVRDEIEGSNLDFVETVGQFLNGKLHWILDHAALSVVVSFDLKSEVFGLIELPCERLPICCWSLGVVDHNKLCALSNHSFLIDDDVYGEEAVVWVMEEYGVKESWRKLEPPFPTLTSDSDSLFYNKKGEVVVFVGHAFLVYNPEMNMLEYMDGIPRRMLLCMESLVAALILSIN